MGILKLITYAAGVAALVLSGYLAKLLDDSNFMEQVTAIPSENITYFHIIALVVIVWLLISLLMTIISRAIIIVLLIIAIGAEGTFAGMNFNGIIVEQTSVLEDVQNGAEDLLDDAGDLLDDLKDVIDD
jgi:glucan phosphoethanolaminetransferase (alkaline phosphatase superfamily)